MYLTLSLKKMKSNFSVIQTDFKWIWLNILGEKKKNNVSVIQTDFIWIWLEVWKGWEVMSHSNGILMEYFILAIQFDLYESDVMWKLD